MFLEEPHFLYKFKSANVFEQILHFLIVNAFQICVSLGCGVELFLMLFVKLQRLLFVQCVPVFELAFILCLGLAHPCLVASHCLLVLLLPFFVVGIDQCPDALGSFRQALGL